MRLKAEASVHGAGFEPFQQPESPKHFSETVSETGACRRIKDPAP